MANFTVWCPEYGQEPEDGMLIKDAFDASMAAVFWAERYETWNNEWPIASQGECVRVMVQEEGSNTQSQFVVSGEIRPHYSATPPR